MLSLQSIIKAVLIIESTLALENDRTATQILSIYPHSQKNSSPQVSVFKLNKNENFSCPRKVRLSQLELMPGDRLVVRTGQGGRVIDSEEGSLNIQNLLTLSLVENYLQVSYIPSLMTLTLPLNIPPSRRRPVATFSVERSPNGSMDDNVATAPNPVQETILGNQTDFRPSVCFKHVAPQMYAASRAVARLITERNETGRFRPNTARVSCTGSLIGKGNFLLTNYHCIKQIDSEIPQMNTFSSRRKGIRHGNQGSLEGRTISLTANFRDEAPSCSNDTLDGTVQDRNGSFGTPSATQGQIVTANSQLDYALLELYPTEKGTNLSDIFGSLTLRGQGPRNGEPIYIPQHAQGHPKVITVSENGQPARVWMESDVCNNPDRNETLSVAYNADTEPGSSGSPVLSQDDNTVVALHHAGTNIISYISNIDSDGACNEGIRMDVIVRDLIARKALPFGAVARSCDQPNP
uniref:Uncharacterized protein AlNc14C439G11649 n=1 Tax=Albugo laibachii Nc14 TaxID=890382 RepID=F0WZQ8_9STRA|nr:conserved hypothetical protein [Albugo laibachii Nc14]|eukprot:CCA26985.1 conserved hypothetical protein [Albugo laibachii Nc14]